VTPHVVLFDRILFPEIKTFSFYELKNSQDHVNDSSNQYLLAKELNKIATREVYSNYRHMPDVSLAQVKDYTLKRVELGLRINQSFYSENTYLLSSIFLDHEVIENNFPSYYIRDN
jgi:hypothetical protein